MTCRKSNNQRLAMDNRHIDSLNVFDRETQEPNIQGLVMNHPDLVIGDNVSQREIYRRVELAESTYELRNNLMASRRNKTYTYPAELTRGSPPCLLASNLQVFESSDDLVAKDP